MVLDGKLDVLGPEVTNDAAEDIVSGLPFQVTVTLEGTSPILFHRWSNEAVAEKAIAKKGSAEKKSDNVESYVYRTESGEIGIPGEYLRQAIIHAAKFRQDPRSPRKSAMDLFKAGLVSLTENASLGTDKWDYLDARRVIIQRSAITRQRPAFHKGWKATFDLQVLLPEYIDHRLLNEVITQAGQFIGLADFRPTYGRFQVVAYTVWQGNGEAK